MRAATGKGDEAEALVPFGEPGESNYWTGMVVPALEIGVLDPGGITEIEKGTSVPVRTSFGTENVTSQRPTTS